MVSVTIVNLFLFGLTFCVQKCILCFVSGLQFTLYLIFLPERKGIYMNQTTSSKWSIKTLALIGLMTAVICVISPFSIPIPISPVPITLGIFAIYLSLFSLGMTKGFLSCVIYLCLGLAGLPVFAGFTGGAGKLLGPTGGYLFGYLFLALIAGFFIDRFGNKWYLTLVGMLLGTAVCYAFGTAWLAIQLHLTFIKALWAGVIPYIPADLVKMVLALLVGIPLRKALRRAGLI